MSHYILLADFGSTYTKFNLVDVHAETFRAKVTLPTSQSSTIMDCYHEGKELLLKEIDFDDDKDCYEEFFCSSAWGGFKMVVIGFTHDLTRKAAEYAALGSGTRIVKDYYYDLSEEDIQEIQTLKPDAVLLTGGTNKGNQSFVLDVAAKMAKYLDKMDIIYAGNEQAQDAVRNLFKNNQCPLHIVENVMPEVDVINIEPVRAISRQIFMDKILQTNGLKEVAEFSQLPIIPTPTAVLKATELYGLEKGESILVVDVGGATTDVHSYGKGLPMNSNVHYQGLLEPELKRSVEGDLGMRESSQSVVNQIGLNTLLRYLDFQWTPEVVDASIQRRVDNHKYIPHNQQEHALDQLLASFAIHTAVKRHVGRLTKIDNVSYRQTGKDLRNCAIVIATGGVMIHAENPLEMMEDAFQYSERVLNPKAPDFYLDQNYILSAVGLVSQKYPKLACTLMSEALKIM